MKKLDRFILREVISDGPAGTVYRAEEILPGDNRRTVALKVMPMIAAGAEGGGQRSEESSGEKRFFGEVKMLAQLAIHPHVVAIYAMGFTGGYPWLAMEYGAGTLASRIGEAPGDVWEIVKVLEHAARGLAAMHALKPPLVHQDLKPANILVDSLGNYKIADFSSATVAAAHRTQAPATVKYAAPELLSSDFGGVGPATDLYALGHIAYEMALGTRIHRQAFPAVFEGNTSKEPQPNKWMMWHVSIGMKAPAVVELVPGFPMGISEAIGRLMNKPLAERYASTAELLSDLGVLRQELSGPAGASAPPPLPGSAARNPQKPAEASTASAAASPSAGASRSGRSAAGAPAISGAGSPAESASAAGAKYWVRLRGKVSGPFDLSALQMQLKRGQISRLHQVSTDQAMWKQASEVEGLYGPTVV